MDLRWRCRSRGRRLLFNRTIGLLHGRSLRQRLNHCLNCLDCRGLRSVRTGNLVRSFPLP